MKNKWILLLFLSGCLLQQVAVASAVRPDQPLTRWQELKLSEFIQLRVSDIELLTGKRFNLVERISFGLLKHKLKKELRKKGDKPTGEVIHRIGGLKWWKIVLYVALLAVLLIAVIGVSKIG